MHTLCYINLLLIVSKDQEPLGKWWLIIDTCDIF
jgi:hypothetical protein